MPETRPLVAIRSRIRANLPILAVPAPATSDRRLLGFHVCLGTGAQTFLSAQPLAGHFFHAIAAAGLRIWRRRRVSLCDGEPCGGRGGAHPGRAEGV